MLSLSCSKEAEARLDVRSPDRPVPFSTPLAATSLRALLFCQLARPTAPVAESDARVESDDPTGRARPRGAAASTWAIVREVLLVVTFVAAPPVARHRRPVR